MPTTKTVVGVLSDLMFTVKIADAAKHAGLQTLFVKSQADALARAEEKPALMIFDLNCSITEPLATIAKLKADEKTRNVSLLGFVSHVQTDLKQAALDNGCDVVIARSALSQNLPAILRRYGGDEISGSK